MGNYYSDDDSRTGWSFGAGAAPTIYDNGGLPTPTDRVPARAPQMAAPGSNYLGDGPTDPDTNRRNISAPSRLSVSPETMQMYTNAGNAYDPLGTKPMRDASTSGVSYIQSLYPRGTYPDTPSPRDMPKALAAESLGRFGRGDMSRLQNLDTGFGTFMTGREGAMPDSSGGGFVRGNTAYNVNDTSQAGIQRVTARGASPLYTNIKPEDAVAGLNNQMIGQPADEARLGLDRYQRANDIRKQMIATRDKDIPAGGYAPVILGDPNEALNAERTQRWKQEELMQSAKNNPELRGIIQQLIQSDSARGINENNIAGRMNELGLQGRNQLAAEDVRQRGALGLEGLRRAGRLEEIGQQGADQWALQEARLGAEAPYRDAQAGYYGAQTRKLEDDAALGKTEYGMATKLATDIMKNEGVGFDIAMAKALKTVLGANRAAALQKEGKAVGYGSGGYIGYADGGAVQPMSAAEKLLAEMDAKYGKTAGSAPAPVPQPAPAPQPVQQPAQQPQGIADRFRGYFGSPDTRMKQNGLAFGGAVPAQDVPGGRAVAQAVAGRQVFGQSDGSGRDDALPAVIDGERPAALTSGEFVWPVHAVKYFGMAKLNKMLAEAEKGMAPQDEPA